MNKTTQNLIYLLNSIFKEKINKVLKLWQKYKILDVEVMDKLFRISSTSKIDSVINSANNSIDNENTDPNTNTNKTVEITANNSTIVNDVSGASAALEASLLSNSSRDKSKEERRKRRADEDEDLRRPKDHHHNHHTSSPVKQTNNLSPNTTANEISKVSRLFWKNFKFMGFYFLYMSVCLLSSLSNCYICCLNLNDVTPFKIDF